VVHDARPGITPRRARVPGVEVENYSGYDSRDIARMVRAGQKAMRAPSPLKVVVTPTPQRTRGCAVVGGKDVVIAVAPPSRFYKKKLARIVEHELLHTKGKEHDDMTEEELWSEGPEPSWSRGKKVRYRGKGKSVREKLQ
jgi:hypothetical protein